MIRFTFNNSTRAIDLLAEDEAHHLVRECHARQGNLIVGTIVHLLAEAVRSTDDEYQSACHLLLTLYPLCKLHRPEILAVLVKKYHSIRRLQKLQYLFALTFLLLFFAESLSVFEFWDGSNLERHVMSDAVAVVADASYEMFVYGLSNLY